MSGEGLSRKETLEQRCRWSKGVSRVEIQGRVSGRGGSQSPDFEAGSCSACFRNSAYAAWLQLVGAEQVKMRPEK